MDPRPALGRSGEEAAARLYRGLGFDVVTRNFRCRAGEIDIVARRGRVVAFCEVKTRSSDRFGVPAEAVGRTKQQRLRRSAAVWLAQARPGSVEVRFDVVAVSSRAGRMTVEHIPGAF